MEEGYQYTPENGGIPAESVSFDNGEGSPQNKNKLTAMIAAAVAVIAVVGIVVAGIFTGWFGLAGKGPAIEVEEAINNTLFAGNFTASLKVGSGSDKISVDARVVINEKDEEIYYIIEDDDRKIALDGKDIYVYSEDYATSDDVDDLDEICDMYSQFKSGKDINWKSILKDMNIDDYVDYRQVEEFFDLLHSECLEDKEWVKKHLTLEKKKNEYTYELEIDDIIEELFAVAEEADVLDVDEDDVDDLIDELKGLDVEATVTLKNKYLSEVDIEISWDDFDFDFYVEFTDVGETKITEEELEEIADDVEAWEDDHICPDCGSYSYDADEDYCPNCDDGYGYCDYCDDYDYLYEYGSYDLCWDCYYDYKYGSDDDEYGYCDFCDDYDYMYTYSGKELCWDCYYDYKYGSDSSDYGYCDYCDDYGYLYDYGYSQICGDCYSDYAYGSGSSDYGYCDYCDEYGYLYDYGYSQICGDCYSDYAYGSGSSDYGYCDYCGEYAYLYDYGYSEICGECYLDQ
ncbi:MAG: hypothetical protein IJD22_00760 [Clostridia bacterium]|nr:hypothetical protein [Clostridia bacterium]